ncbi:trypsin-like peptidase domain-containing protein [Paracidobacterium acidisoli]|uniref:PDZ domain-containing protein n=1 Tax=Paracidobacterium acidisoli TaxID=2303751 RepID=A0A372IR56_9BACT|nr:trypsin-like peptidase domain-containing protein [Paracidobacterium acidisoli]MBT9330268.1 trypsin-like peptidase domain-containing protein [Paracidobacterium acidisoli]
MKSLSGWLRYRRLTSTFTILATLSAGILIGSVVAHGVRGQESKVDSTDATALQIPAPRQLPTDFTRIAKEVGPAVVNISTETLPKQSLQQPHRHNPHSMQPFQQQPPDGGDGGDDDQDQDQGQGQGQGGLQDFFNRFFGMNPDQVPDQSGQVRESLGSGFIVDPKGYIITNNHVVEKADRIMVRLASDPDGSQPRPAKVIGVDKFTDIAVIKISTDRPLPTVKLGNSDGSEVGDWVIAIGSPFALSKTVTAGIVSAKNRTLPGGGAASQFQHFIQTDAAINPGNSGGPLLNMAGEVIGVNTAIYTQSAGYEGIGFAMPSNTVINTYNQLIGPEHKVIRGSIGISFQANTSSAVSRIYGFKSGGVLISSVRPNQPAANAGLKVGDIIVSIDGQPIKDGDELVSNISSRHPGSTIDIGYLRNGQEQHAKVTVGDWEKVQAGAGADDDQGSDNNSTPDTAQSRLGVTVSNLPQGAPQTLHGVLIQSVKPGSFADEIGLDQYEGGVITSVNRHPVRNVNDFQTVVAAIHSGQDIAFEIVDPQHPGNGSAYIGGTLP